MILIEILSNKEDMLIHSKLHLYSLGYVIEDIEEDSHYVKVRPIEILSDMDGNLGNVTKEKNHNIDIENDDKIAIHYKDDLVVAKWLNLSEPNRITAPNVCKGETIRIFRYSDTDKYYWSTLYNELDLRKLEKATYVFSNKRTIENPELINSFYYFTFDTINKVVRIHTDASDGELTTYDIEINTKEGMLTIADGRDNVIELDSSIDKLKFTINKDIEMNAPNITMNCEKYTINTKDYYLNSTTNYVNTSTHNLKAESSNLTTNITLTGNMDITGYVKNNGISIDAEHKHLGNAGFDVSVPNS